MTVVLNQLRLESSSDPCLKNFLVGDVAFGFTGFFVGLAIDSLFGNSQYLLYVGWVAVPSLFSLVWRTLAFSLLTWFLHWLRLGSVDRLCNLDYITT